MKIGLIDVDGHNFLNLPLMKISAYHKARGDAVKWYEPLFDGPPAEEMDRVYMSKVFTFSPDYEHYVNAKEIIKGGTGYFYPDGGDPLPEEIEHIYPDYSLYGITKTAYGFLTRGCPRNCGFCIVGKKEGLRSRKVADLSEFWKGQKEIVLMDPNILAAREHEDLLNQLSESRAKVDINQGLDARLLTERKIDLLKKVRIKSVHFAWDNPEDESAIVPKLKMFNELSGIRSRDVTVYVLTNFNSTHEQDLHRIYKIREIGMTPYVMVYDRDKTKPEDLVRRVQRWANNKKIWFSGTAERFEDYRANGKESSQ